MSKPYLVIRVEAGKVGAIKERSTWAEAVDAAVVIAHRDSKVPIKDIREELEAQTNFIEDGSDIEVMIAQADDD